ncbi:hypothetical protein BURMUCF2_0226 [Burkholderia multivorans CF2]|nr:hypothetical protein BURMUCF2_0226 [Burkholderia multivorans CF2]
MRPAPATWTKDAAGAPLWFGILLDAQTGCNRTDRRRGAPGGR